MNKIRNNKPNMTKQNNSNKQQQASAKENGKNLERRRRSDGKMRKMRDAKKEFSNKMATYLKPKFCKGSASFFACKLH